MKYLKLFETLAAFNIYKSSEDYITPNVSICEDAPTVIHYDSYVASEPTLEGNKILCKYNVTDTSEPIKLYYQESSSGSGSGSGSGDGGTPMFSSMIIDGVEQEVTNEYIFDTTGEHTVLFTLIEDVTSIGEYAFNNCSELISVTIGNSVTSIGEYAFYYCSGLTSITIPDSVISIGTQAFHYCLGLTSVTIPDSVTSIGNSAFLSCYGLTSVTIGSGITSIGSSAFNGCSGLTSITIPDSVTSIDEGAFRGCSGLTSITIPNSVTSIGVSAFGDCLGLISVTLNSDSIVSKTYTSSSSIKNIFGGQVTEYIIGNSVTSIGSSAFYGCSGLTSITIPNSVTSIGGSAFSGCSGLTSVTIGNSVTVIGEGAFYNCSGLTSITIPGSVTSIGDYAFSGCSKLVSIACNATTAPTILNNTFRNVKTGGTLTVPAGSTGYDVWIGTDNYYLGTYGWTKLERNVLCKYNVNTTSSSIKLFNANNFSSMIVDGVEQEVTNEYIFNTTGEHIVVFTLAEGVTSISNGTFRNCSGLTSITIPDSVASIGQYAFDGCSGLTNITCNKMIAPNTQNDTFYNIKSDGILTVHAGSIGYDVWMGTSNYYLGNYNWNKVEVLEENEVLCKYNVTTSSSIKLFNANIFSSMIVDGVEQEVTNEYIFNITGEHIVVFTLIKGVTSISNGTFRNCSGLTSVTIGNSVTVIGEGAFYGCSGLTSITCNATTAPNINSYTFKDIKTGGTLTVPIGSTGYNVWMGTGNYYLGKYNWTKVEQ